MRKTASEIIRNLEMRVARLERNTKVATDFDPDSAVLYFDITFDEYSAEEDGAVFSDDQLEDMEEKAVRNVSKLFRERVEDEGHDNMALICKIFVDDLKTVAKIIKKVQRKTIGGEDQIEVDVDYHVAQNFTLYPQGIRETSYQMGGNGHHEDLEEYLEEAGLL